MEAEIIKKLNLRGIKAELQQVQLGDEEEFQFAQRAYKIVKEFAAFSSKQNQRIGVTEFLIKNVERFFKQVRGSSLEAEVSRFVSVLSLHKNSSEVALYRDLFINNINVKAAKLFVKFFLEMNQINPALYENRSKLLKHLRLDIKKALSLSAMIFRDDVAIANFSQAISNLLESAKGSTHTITGEQFGKHLMGSYFLSRNVTDKGRTEGGEVWLNWNSVDPQAFEISVPAPSNPENLAANTVSHDIAHADGNGFALERVNADFRKEVKKQKTATLEEKVPTPTSKVFASPLPAKANPHSAQEPAKANLFKICHKYLFADNSAPTKPKAQTEAPVDLSTDADIDKQLVFLRNKLEKQKLELEMQRNVWKLILNNSKQAIKNYKDLKGEITSTEALTNAFLNVIDKNTDEWRRLYIIKSNDVEDLYRYKFLIAAVLESCSQDLSRDLKEFRFAHDEDGRQMETLLGQRHGFNLNEYLNTVYKSNKLKFDAALVADELGEEEQQDNDFSEEPESFGRAERLDEFSFPRNNIDQQSKNSSVQKSGASTGRPGRIPVENNISQNDADDHETDEERANRLKNMRANLDRMKQNLIYGKAKSPKPSENNRSVKTGLACEIISTAH